MAQTNYTPISLYYSTTASAVPTAANLVQGELAINTNDGKLYYEDSSGVVQVLATKSTGSIGGSNTQVQFNNSGSLGGSSGLTWDGSFLTTSSIKNSALTSGRVTYAGASGLLSDSSNLTFDGTKLTSAGLVSTGALNVSGSGWGVLPYVANSLVVDSNAGETRLFATGTNTSTQGNFLFYTGTTNGTASERMRITSAGLVGIGTSSPNRLLSLYATQPVFQITNVASGNTQGTIQYQESGATNFILDNQGSGSGGAIIFQQAGTERMRIASNGLLLQGSTSATFTMPSINGASFKTSNTGGGSPIVEIGNTDTTSGSDSSPALMVFKNSTTTTSDARFIQFSANGSGTTMGAIVGNGSGLCQFANFSDISLKKNIQPLSGSLSKIIALKPSSFDMISDNGHVNAGFIAQDVQKVYPEYVIENMANEGEKPLMAITGGMSGGFIAELVKAIQELKAEFDEYKATHP